MDRRIVVVGADFGETGDGAIREGLRLIAVGEAQALYVVHALSIRTLPAEEETQPDPDADTIAMVHESLERRVSLAAAHEKLPYHEELIRIEVRKGTPADALLQACQQHHATLLIVGTHGRHGLNRLLAGSIAETLVRQSECSVLVVRPEHRSLPRSQREPSARQVSLTPTEVDSSEFASSGDKPWHPAEDFASRPARETSG